MARKKISDFPAATALQGTELLLGDQGGKTKVITPAQLVTYAAVSGTWIPQIGIGNINPSTTGITYYSRLGSYLKIGSLVVLSCYVELSSKGSNTGFVSVMGLPFAPKTRSMGKVSYYHGWASLTGAPSIDIGSYQTIGQFMQTGTAASSFITDSNITDSFEFVASFIYLV